VGRTPTPIFAATILLSAFLLFQVQPLIGKVILPWFGGSAAVWSAALLFFQVFLLGGYAYAHFMIRRFQPRMQMFVHIGLLAASCAVLPILPSVSWKPTTPADPTFRILALLAATIGLPYFLLSSTSPLLQAWYVRRTGTRVPYRLFALSNFGSMLGLLSFPFLVEPHFTSRQQAHGWSGIYVGFVVLCATAAWMSRRQAASATPGSGSEPEGPAYPEAAETLPPPGPGRPRPGELVLWVSLAACASTLLVASTNHLTQNVAPIPLLWVLPLALYLVTFILAFEGDGIYRRAVFGPLLLVALLAMAYLSFYASAGNVPIMLLIPTFTIGLFICCMVCHGELAKRRPSPEHLTLFYFMVSLGGALGGVFVALVAPRIFNSYLELPLGLLACAVIAAIVWWRLPIPKLGPLATRSLLLLGVWFTLVPMGRDMVLKADNSRLMVRNFYGVLRVADEVSRSSETSVRRLYHGTIVHGAQLLDDKNKYRPTAYYGENSGVGRAIRAGQMSHDHMKIGVIGLGAGVLASYGRAGDTYRFYEINPQVERIAREEFSFYEHSPADQQILLGDARLVLERAEPQEFDLLVVDAFSGDAVPVHLLTKEAFALYSRHLKPGGTLALHISNLYLDLVPVSARGAEGLGKQAMTVSDGGGRYTFPSEWVLVTSDSGLFESKAFDGARIERATAPPGFRGWTDSYSNLLQVFQFAD
jgi:hypothetical protein